MRTRLMDALIKWRGSSAQRFERHGPSEVEKLVDAQSAVERERSGCGHGLRPVKESESFLGFKRERRDSCFAERAAGSGTLAVIDHFTFTDQRQREMREW